jgi:hypothetical protein
MHDPEAIADTYRTFARVECAGYSDIYRGLALAVADDEELLGFIAGMPVAQPNLFLASIQYLTGPQAMPGDGGALRAFVRARGGEIAALMRTRRTQTNEVGRCAVLLPALPRGPLALVEVGASAGLVLLMDSYRYDFDGRMRGPPDSPVRLRCAVSGDVPLPAEVPEIVWRRGLDPRPVDPRDDDAVRWLLACVWPDHAERRERLEAAIGVARADPPRVDAGDLATDLPAILAAVPSDARLVVYHTAVFPYVREEGRRAFAEVLLEESHRREVTWISAESHGMVPEIAELAPFVDERRFLLGRTTLTEGRRRDELLGFAHAHGAELEGVGGEPQEA